MAKNNKEIEGKWINIGGLYQPERAAKTIEIVQGYVAIEKGGSAVRVRRAESDGRVKHSLAAKGEPISAGEKIEEEDVISRRLFNKLWTLTEGRRIEKIRYVMPRIGVMLLGETVMLTPEVDEFQADLEGLIMMEIEVKTKEQLAQLREYGQSAFGTDVTDDKSYSNAQLAINGLPVLS